MNRNPEYQFVSTDTNALTAQLIASYESITGANVRPASPERLFIQWIADVIVQERVINNYTGNQNIPSRAEGANLDAIGQLFYDKNRPEAQSAKCTERFYISEAQASIVLIPAGTRVTDIGNLLVWETTTDAHVKIGEISTNVMVQCQTPGVIGNGYEPGQIIKIVDVYDYHASCSNTTRSDGGADQASDDEYYALMKASEDAYSDAGAKGGYIYFAKQVSTEIADVVANSPAPGHVCIFALMAGGVIASAEIKAAILSACNDEFVRPLTDYVTVADSEISQYSIDLTYFIADNSVLSTSEIHTAVESAVERYKLWQCAKLGRDVNPSYLMGLLMQTGVKRIELRSPAFKSLRDGSDNTAPQLAEVNDITIVNGGYEDE